MHRLRLFGSGDILAGILCLITALTLQIQVTLFQTEHYIGLRINLTDLLVPLAGLAILYSLLRRRSHWPHWHMPHMYAWLAALTAVMVFALCRTYFLYDEISRWALINKFIGWFILAATMGLGGWIGSNATRPQIIVFVKTLLYAALAILIYQCVILFLQSIPAVLAHIGLYEYTSFPMSGMMANRNAYGLFMLAVFSFSLLLYFSGLNIIKQAYINILFLLMPTYLIFNYSRAAFIGLCVILTAIFFLNRAQWRKLRIPFLCFVAGAICLWMNFDDEANKVPIFYNNPSQVLFTEEENVQYPGDQMRLAILKDSRDMIHAHPILGSGLGSALLYQKQKHGEIINVIDSVPLWILVEMGAIGLAVFLLFFLQVVKSLWAQRKNDDEFSRVIRQGILFTILGFSIMAMFHEITYTRHMWFLIGLGLTLPSRMRQDG